MNCRAMYLIVAILYEAALGWGGGSKDSHTILTKASFAVLRESGYQKLYDDLKNIRIPNDSISYYKQIWSYVNEPDVPGMALSDIEVQKYGGLSNYNFNQLIENKLNLLTTSISISPIPYSLLMSPLVPNQISHRTIAEHIIAGNTYSLERARYATQHTYVEDISNQQFKFMEEITIAPWAAQAEYNMAVELWKNKQIGEALRRLGRTLHYAQDLCVPHHNELVGNWPDIKNGIEQLLAKKDFETNSSQRDLEDTKFPYTVDTNNNLLLNGISVPQTRLNGNNAHLVTISWLLMNLHTFIQKSRFIEKCDNVEMYTNQLPVNIPTLSDVFNWSIYPTYMSRNITTPQISYRTTYVTRLVWVWNKGVGLWGVPGHFETQRIASTNMFVTPMKTYWGSNDNYQFVYDNVVPVALQYSALIIEKFFNEAKGYNSDVSYAKPRFLGMKDR